MDVLRVVFLDSNALHHLRVLQTCHQQKRLPSQFPCQYDSSKQTVGSAAHRGEGALVPHLHWLQGGAERDFLARRFFWRIVDTRMCG